MANHVASSEEKAVVDQIPGLLLLYKDGSTARIGSPPPFIAASQDFVDGVATKDVVINVSTGVWVRIFLPERVANNSSEQQRKKVPLVLHFHGGGMCTGSPALPIYHNFCSRMAVKSRSIWISVYYRLAPEHRLPTAHDDCFEALCWLHSQICHSAAADDEPWLSQYGDFSRCFLAGESAGGTILHYVAVRAAGKDWNPLKLRGLMFIHAGIFGEVPSMKPSTDRSVTAESLKAFVRFCLPVGAQIGDPINHPLHPDHPSLSEIQLPPAFIAMADRDVLCDGPVEYYHALKKAGKDAELFITEGEGHCFHLGKAGSASAQMLESRLIEFMQRQDTDSVELQT